MKKRNITIAVDEELARWARVRASQSDQSVSQMLAELLDNERRRQERVSDARYQAAMRDFLAIRPRVLRRRGERLPTRDEIHER